MKNLFGGETIQETRTMIFPRPSSSPPKGVALEYSPAFLDASGESGAQAKQKKSQHNVTILYTWTQS